MTPVEKIEALRGTILALHEERATLEAQPRTREAVRALIIAEVLAWHEHALKVNSRRLRLLAGGQHATPFNSDTFGSPGALIALLVGPDKMTEALLQQIGDVPEGIAAQPHAERLDAISHELDEVEAHEERLIVEAEQCGVRVTRRSAARPEIVLGNRPAAPEVPVRSRFYQGNAEAARPRAYYPVFPSTT